MKVTNQPDGLFTIEASQGKDWTEEGEVTNIKNSATATPTTPSQEDEDERGV